MERADFCQVSFGSKCPDLRPAACALGVGSSGRSDRRDQGVPRHDGFHQVPVFVCHLSQLQEYDDFTRSPFVHNPVALCHATWYLHGWARSYGISAKSMAFRRLSVPSALTGLETRTADGGRGYRTSTIRGIAIADRVCVSTDELHWESTPMDPCLGVIVVDVNITRCMQTVQRGIWQRSPIQCRRSPR